MEPLFQSGDIVATKRSIHELHPYDVGTCLTRHLIGDWGNLDEEDRKLNEYALNHRQRIFSAYHDRNGTKFYIITEADRSSTTIMLPSEY